jgi:hypothetical protein
MNKWKRSFLECERYVVCDLLAHNRHNLWVVYSSPTTEFCARLLENLAAILCGGAILAKALNVS